MALILKDIPFPKSLLISLRVRYNSDVCSRIKHDWLQSIKNRMGCQPIYTI